MANSRFKNCTFNTDDLIEYMASEVNVVCVRREIRPLDTVRILLIRFPRPFMVDGLVD